MTVYVVQQDNNKDFTAAEKFGRLDVLFTRGCFPDDHVVRTKEMEDIARAKLKGFDPDFDYVLLAGDPVAMLLVGAVLRESFDLIPVLKWDKQAQAYYAVRLNLEDFDNVTYREET